MKDKYGSYVVDTLPVEDVDLEKFGLINLDRE